MSLPPRPYLDTFTPEVLSDLRRVVAAMQAELDECDPEDCMHDPAMIHPVELVHWIEQAQNDERRKPLHLRPAGQPGRQPGRGLETNLAVAG